MPTLALSFSLALSVYLFLSSTLSAQSQLYASIIASINAAGQDMRVAVDAPRASSTVETVGKSENFSVTKESTNSRIDFKLVSVCSCVWVVARTTSSGHFAIHLSHSNWTANGNRKLIDDSLIKLSINFVREIFRPNTGINCQTVISFRLWPTSNLICQQLNIKNTHTPTKNRTRCV